MEASRLSLILNVCTESGIVFILFITNDIALHVYLALLINIILHHLHIRILHHKPLRQTLQILETSRTLRFAANVLLDAFGKFRWQCGFQSNQRHSVFPVRLSDFQAIRGMCIDQHLIALIDVANRGNPRGVVAAAGYEAVILDFCKQRGSR